MSGRNADVLNLSKLRGSVDGIVPSVIAVGRETTIPDETGGEGTTPMKLKLKARVNRSDAQMIRHALEQLSAKGSVRKVGGEFVVEAERLDKSLLIWQRNRCPCAF